MRDPRIRHPPTEITRGVGPWWGIAAWIGLMASVIFLLSLAFAVVVMALGG